MGTRQHPINDTSEISTLLDETEEDADLYGSINGGPGRSQRTWLKRTFSKIEAGSLRGSIFVLASTAIGAGVLSLPLVLRDSGLILGCLLVVLFCRMHLTSRLQLFFGGILALFSMELLIKASEETKCSTYSTLTSHVFGPRMGQFVEATLVVYCFGAIIAYLVVIAGAVHHVLAVLRVTGLLGDSNVDLSLITLLICLPLCLLRDVSGLRYASVFAVFVSVAVTVRGIQHGSIPSAGSDGFSLFTLDWRIFSSTTITFFAYTCHVNVFAVYSELQDRGTRRMRKVMWRALYLEFLLYGCVAVFGYLTWHSATQGNILDNYPSSDPLFIIARVCVACSLTVAVPINLHPCRTNLESLLFRHEEWSASRHVVETLVLIIPALLLAVTAPGVSVVFGLLGASCCVIICYCVPILAYQRVFADRLAAGASAGLYLLLASIVVIGAVSVAQNVRSLVQRSDSV